MYTLIAKWYIQANENAVPQGLQYGADFVPLTEPNKGPLMLVESLARVAGFVRPQAAETEAKATGH
jgi:hypothetical protein